ncbi:FK506-binding protein 15-like isoform X16 [Syngnathoides biaculeatus]|uniref:FK506-binding protein 15-like isoform X16 n=1 Tax=Syngnathoides biaculeatus TaxID=300417 RepID=UPI002ADE38EF|nr:FK506-binding protein 15-like isoform X16 [Syngnathoides biaculeatus]
MFGGDDEDGDFLSPKGGAKLASLFGLDEEINQGNESLHYTAPKQPRKSSNPVSVIQTAALSPGILQVLFATAVQAFRYINGQYVKQGKLGAAILGNHMSKEYKLLLYLSQQKKVASANIHIDFIFTLQSNNYCTFYDDLRQNWSLMFESEKSMSNFCKEVCLAKANSCNVLDSVVTQDLSLGEGQAVQYGDSLEVTYGGWLLQNHTIGQMFDSNQKKDKLLRLKIGAGKVIQGWENEMLGMRKAGCRLIVVPLHLANGAEGVPDCVPANTTLIFEAELKRVKFSKDNGSTQVSASCRVAGTPSPAPSVEILIPDPPGQATTLDSSKQGETPLHDKSNSLCEQFITTDSTKAKLISRMAKMGHPMLSFLTCQHESSDSELEDNTNSRAKDLLVAQSCVEISTATPLQAHVLSQTYPALPPNALPNLTNFAAQPGVLGNAPSFQTYVPTTQLQSVGQVYPTHVPYNGSSDMTSFLMIDARQQNAELQLAVGKVADKVDQLASKMDDFQRQGTFSLGLSGLTTESAMIMENVQRIIQENERLKKEISEKTSCIEEQNCNISELFNQSQRYMEQSNTVVKKRNYSLNTSSKQSEGRQLQAQQDEIRLKEELAVTTAQLSQIKLESLAHQQKVLELQTELSTRLLNCEHHSKHINVLESLMGELKEVSERAQTQYRTEMERRKEIEQKLKNMEEEVNDLRRNHNGLKQVKRVMNGVFHSLRGEFDLNESYSGHTVLGVVVNTIKSVTLLHLHGKDCLTTIKQEDLADQEAQADRGDLKQKDMKTYNVFLVNKESGFRKESGVSKQLMVLCETKQDHHYSGEDQINQNGAVMQEEFSVLKEHFHSKALETTHMTASGSHKKLEQPGDDTCEAANSEAGPHESVITRIENTENSGEMDPDFQKSFGPPVKPPLPPNEVPLIQVKDQSLSGDSLMKNGESVFQNSSICKSASRPVLDEKKDELSLKGCPQAPLSRNDNNDDNDDPDWLS